MPYYKSLVLFLLNIKIIFEAMCSIQIKTIFIYAEDKLWIMYLCRNIPCFIIIILIWCLLYFLLLTVYSCMFLDEINFDSIVCGKSFE